ncbi:MAG: hypothetical protein M1814_006805 [Vezdaea aestivalis]|nr:MAG: hypothetical protein M1814_006805 [Vezdaea aestivalis]
MAGVIMESAVSMRIAHNKGSSSSSADHSHSTNGAATSLASSFDNSENSTPPGQKAPQKTQAELFNEKIASTTMDELEGQARLLEISESAPVQDPGRLRLSNIKSDSFTSSRAAGYEHSELSNGRTASLDGKSIASGMAALDEKESLRPDDSASLQAFEEEDGLSNAGSIAAGGSKAHRIREASKRLTQPNSQLINGKDTTASATVQLDGQDVASTQMPCVSKTLGDPASEVILPPGYVRHDPDEKLLEALDSPKDRLFILRLEQDVIDFVRDSRDASLDLPPVNSFYRMLSHKLADYYFLTHFVDSRSTAVRLYRTPFCRLPPPLTGIANPLTMESTPPSSAPSVKIMRRVITNKDGSRETLPSSSAASSDGISKPASEMGFEEGIDVKVEVSQQSNDATSLKDKLNLSREQREAKYKEARERIFKDFEEVPPGEGEAPENETSRSSSVTGKKKLTKRQKVPKDDSFEARSKYSMVFNNHYQSLDNPGVPHYTAFPSHMGPQNMTGHTMISGPPYQHSQGPQADMYPYQSQWNSSCTGQQGGIGFGPYKQMMPSNGYPNSPVMHTGPSNQFPGQQPSPADYQGGQTYSRPAMSQYHPQWSGPQFSNTYQQQSQTYLPTSLSNQMPNQMSTPIVSPDSSNFQMGAMNPQQYSSPQYPFNHMPQQGQGKMQHPIQGNFYRNSLNPHTHNFIPTSQSYSVSAPGNACQSMPYYNNQHLPGSPGHGEFGNGRPYQMDQMHPSNAASFSGVYPAPPRFQSQTHLAQNFYQSPGVPPTDRSFPSPPEQASISTWTTPSSLPPKPNFTSRGPIVVHSGSTNSLSTQKTGERKAESGQNESGDDSGVLGQAPKA